MAGTSATKVTGKIELCESTKCFYWRIMLTWYENGKRQRKSVATGLTETNAKNTRNKKKAEAECDKAIKEQEAMLSEVRSVETVLLNAQLSAENTLFANFIEYDWLEAVRRGDRRANRKKVKQTTFGGYQTNVQNPLRRGSAAKAFY